LGTMCRTCGIFYGLVIVIIVIVVVVVVVVIVCDVFIVKNGGETR
jgi:tetrahydromethanopterin S-methyltransferase subunit G